MNFFEGQYKSKPNIKLSGSSKSKTKEELIKEAFLERKKREVHSSLDEESTFIIFVLFFFKEERRRLISCIKIQSVFRSYLVRKKIQDEYRIEFDRIFTEKSSNPDTISVFLRLFVQFFKFKISDKERLVKLSNLVLQYKESLINNKYTSPNMLSKFLAIQLRCLNNPDMGLNQSLILRLIEFFTEPRNPTDFQKDHSFFVFNALISNGYLAELVHYSQTKIPPMSQYINSIPIAEPLAHLFLRCFLHIKSSENKFSLSIVSSLDQNLFKNSSIPQIKCILLTMSQLIGKNSIYKQKIGHMLSFYEISLNNSDLWSNFNETMANNQSKLFALMQLFLHVLAGLTQEQFSQLLQVIQSLLFQIPISMEDQEMDEPMLTDQNLDSIQMDTFRIFESKDFLNKLEQSLKYANQEESKNLSVCVSYICHYVLFNLNIKSHESSLTRKLVLNENFIASLWQGIISITIKPQFNNEICLIQMLASGNCPEAYHNDLFRLVAPLSTFCSLYNLFLLRIFDSEFIAGKAIFSKLDLIKMSSLLKDVCIGTVELMHPEIVHSARTSKAKEVETKIPIETVVKARCFTHLFSVCSTFLQKMHRRDIRYGFCPEEHWISNSKYVVSNRLSTILMSGESHIFTDSTFSKSSYIFETENETENKLSLSDIRSLTILQRLPFTVPFVERVQVLENLILKEPIYTSDSACRIRIRRDYLYEDAFDNLSEENVPSLGSVRIVVEMINQLGLEEAGIDGGGLFREFLLSLLETGFDPIRGFFVLTNDGFLYPNPSIVNLVDDASKHYYFLGRILAKAIQSKILSPLKFAGFFLQKIISIEQQLDIDYLATLDPDICKNLLSLKDYEDNVEDLELNFAINANEFGHTKLVELKPGGKDIPVTNENKIEYIFLLAKYKLNTQINDQTKAFKNGIANVIDLNLLRLFNINEIQNLICGSNEFIDVKDWRKYTVYSGGFSDEHKVIKIFWRVLESFSEEQKRKLLKFATSRSRTPLFGFRNLIPNFAIHSSGSADRLPSASTCLNLLKLPPIEDFEIMKEKLICAIESESGFDLS